MTDDLVARVRSPFALTERDAQEIADALESRGKRIDELESRLVDKEARIAELEAENKKLQDLVYRAYQEGFGDAPSKRSEHDNSGNDMAEAWEESYARAALNGAKDV